MKTIAWSLVLSVLGLGCSSRVGGDAPAPTAGGETGPDDAPSLASAVAPTWDGKGFVVHEWGTNTVVVGSDGSLLRGMHHEEEDLPSFVYDRMKQSAISVDVKMETPVTYFYSDTPRTVSVGVRFPKGIFSQWYPRVRGFFPGLPRTGTSYSDPYLDASFAYSSEICRQHMLTPENGMLDWGSVDVLSRDAAVSLPDAPIDRYTWSFARQVEANPVRVGGSEAEKFLFYRGLGNLPMGVKITDGGKKDLLHLENVDAMAPVGTVFILRVEADRASFDVRAEGIAPGGELYDYAPPASLPLDAYVTKLADSMSEALERAGLFRDEARGMVNTWSRQWFKTPGVRVLYLAPQSWTDAQIPLSVTPTPDRTVRVMVIRNEVLMPEVEQADLEHARAFDTDPTGATSYFEAHGRFAEPRLRRALTLLGSTPAAARTLLAKLEGPMVSSSTH